MLENAGLHFVGCDESGKRMEVLRKQHMPFLFRFSFSKAEPACTYEQIVELQDHPFYVGVQFHPEFKSRPRRPSPPFTGDFFLLYLIVNLRMQ
jgi:CTP synthase